MAESNPTQVILTDDGLKIIKAQNTANEAAGNVNDINSDNKLTPSEKIKLKQEYDKDVELYNIDIEQLKSVDLPTAELETAMSNLTDFVTPLFKEMNRTSTVNRDTLDSVFTAFATADKNASQAFVNMVQQVADGAKKAGSDAKEAGEKAQEAGEEAKASANQAQVDATQAKADATTAQQKAQSSIDQLNAHLPDIDEALSTANLVKQNVTKLSNTTEQYHNEYTTGIQNVIKTIDDASTEIDQLSNAIKLKADSTDVTSQINVATQGIQKEVNNKVTDLTTQINQTASAVQILNTTSGLRNLVYNSSYANNAEGWDLMGRGYLSAVPTSSFNGSPGLGINVSGKKETDFTMFAKSKPYKLPNTSPYETDTDNVYSAQAKIKLYGESKVGSEIIACLSYLDANGSRISGWKDMAVKCDGKNYNQWITVKFENYGVPKNAVYVAFYYWEYGNVHGMIVEPMIVFGPKIGQYQPDVVSQSDITASIDNIHLGVKNADGSTSTFNMNGNTVLLDANKIIFNGNTSIQNGTIGTAKIANAAINTAQIADGAINNAKIANASIDDAKINSLNGNKLVENSIAASKINVDDLIANGINTKTLTSVNLNTSTLTTPNLDLGLNGTFTEDFDYTQATTMFLPKKNKGTLTFNHGVLQSKGTMQTYTGGQWGGMNSNYNFQAGIDNSQWTEVAPGYIKLDLFRQDDANFVERTYIDPTGYYYKSGNGIASYLGNVLQTPQVQTPSLIGKYIGPSAGQLRLQIGSNGKDFGLQVGSYGGGEGVLSDFIYNTTSSGSSNVHITENGRLVRTTSASKYKYNIKNPDIETTLGDRLLNVHLATWNDKRAVDSYAEQLSTGEEREKTSIDKYYGLIAEQLRDAGLDMFISYGKNHEIEGIQYDRAWVPLLSVIRRLNDKVNEYEFRLSKLEGASK